MAEGTRWATTPAEWEAKALVAEVAHRLAELGRLCAEPTCLARSELALLIEGWEVGVCPNHALGFPTENRDRIRGLPRRLEDDESLPGPLVR